MTTRLATKWGIPSRPRELERLRNQPTKRVEGRPLRVAAVILRYTASLAVALGAHTAAAEDPAVQPPPGLQRLAQAPPPADERTADEALPPPAEDPASEWRSDPPPPDTSPD